jgi:hypothetical protein
MLCSLYEPIPSSYFLPLVLQLFEQLAPGVAQIELAFPAYLSTQALVPFAGSSSPACLSTFR